MSRHDLIWFMKHENRSIWSKNNKHFMQNGCIVHRDFEVQDDWMTQMVRTWCPGVPGRAPATYNSPLCTCKAPRMQLRKVVFPHPEGPNKP
jgi:hypothetical protein